MLAIKDIAMIYGERLLFTDVSLVFNNKKRYALVGANGSGKTTLMSLLAGLDEPSAGTITLPKSATLGFLQQDQFRYENTRIIDVVIQGKQALWQAMAHREHLLANTENWDEAALTSLSDAEDAIVHADGYRAEALAVKLLLGLGIAEVYHEQPLSVLSGGFKLRVLLAKTLFSEPDILFLDEPTNHLDIVSIAWLENYLKTSFNGMLIFISHDVRFIDQLAQHIIDIDYGEVRQYPAPYAKFLAEKQLIEEQKLQDKGNIEKKIAHMQRFVDRFRATPNKARQAQSRVKMIEKLELPEIAQSSRRAPNFNFTLKRHSGKTVLSAKQIAKIYDDRFLFCDIKLRIERGERIAIVGANGIGKSSFIKGLLGKIEFDEGDVNWGHEVQLGYFSQDHHEELNQSQSLLDWLVKATGVGEQTVLRKVLGQLLFTGDDAHKNILRLSGGEAARLLLARLMIQKPNVLVLDEPTNHLDLEAIEALANALKTYEGTVLVISHDRTFLQKMATKTLQLTENKLCEVQLDAA